MEKMNTKFCPAMWFSGFFALGAIVHAVRYLMHFSIAVNGEEIPLQASGFIVLILGFLSVGLLIVSLKRPCGTNKESGCCK